MPSNPSTSFSASYDKTTKAVSAGVFVFLLLLTLLIPGAGAIRCLGALLLAGAYAWSPRSYTISERCITVHRLIGGVRIPLNGIREARIATPDDFRDCLRLFGNGGLFGYYGLFSTAKLGKCTWYVTNQKKTVVVVSSAGTTVFSPDDVDGFLAAAWAGAPVPMGTRGEPLPDSPSYGTGVQTNILVGGAIAILVIVVVAFAVLYSPGPPACTLTAQSLTIHDRFYPVTLQAAGVDVEHIRLIDFGVDTQWRPTARTNGFANAHYRSGWFRVASGKTVRMYWADSKRLVLLPPKGDGAAILLETADPEGFLRQLRQAWTTVPSGD